MAEAIAPSFPVDMQLERELEQMHIEFKRVADLSLALIDDVVLIPERETVDACRELLMTHGLFVGGSSGTAYAAVKRYAARMSKAGRPKVLLMCADRGTPYLDTVFDPDWVSKLQ